MGKGRISKIPAILLAVVPFVTVYKLDNTIKEAVDAKEIKMAGEDGAITFGLLQNRGMACNMMENTPRVVKGASIIMTVLTVLSIVKSLFNYDGRKKQRLCIAGKSVLAGGALSNTRDRIEKGYVVDYFRLPKLPGAFKKLMYNISDFAILLGLIVSKANDEDN